MKPELTVIPERHALPEGLNTGMTLLVKMHVPPLPVESAPSIAHGVNLALALDRSGSMGHQGRMLQAKMAAHGLIDQLHATDSVSVVTFASKAEVLATAVPGDNQSLLHDLIESVRVGGQTDLHSGWLAGAHQVAANFRQNGLNRVVLLSDGQANRGVTNPEQIVAHVGTLGRTGVGTTTVGVGVDFNEELLEAMAEAGDGNYHYAPQAEDLPGLFAAELTEHRLVLGTRAVFRVLHRARGVRVMSPLNALSEERNCGYRLGNLVAGKTLRVVFDAIFPSDVSGDCSLLTLELEWRDSQGLAHAITKEFHLPRISEAAYSALPPSLEVRLERALLQVARIKRQAAHALDTGRLPEAMRSFEQALAVLEPLAAEPAARQMIQTLVALRERTLGGEVARSSKQAKYEAARLRRKGD